MTKFTKGPWNYRKETREIGVVDRSDTQSFGMIQVVAYIDEWDHKEYASNAHLISAAPDLYEAVELLLADIKVYSQIEHIAPDTLAQNRARAALAKARGEA